jgi:predicted Ser/Thr protein kinase
MGGNRVENAAIYYMTKKLIFLPKRKLFIIDFESALSRFVLDHYTDLYLQLPDGYFPKFRGLSPNR